MRKTLAIAVVAAAFSAISLPANATTLLGPSGLSGAVGQLGGIETVARVCRERCSRGVCKRVCTSTRSDNYGYSERRRHRHWRDRHHYRRHDRGPGIGIEIR